jgi:hypothetical protein
VYRLELVVAGRHPDKGIEMLLGVEKCFPVSEEAAEAFLPMRRRVDRLASRCVAQRRARNPTDIGVDAPEDRAHVHGQVGAHRARIQELASSAQGAPIAQRVPRGGILGGSVIAGKPEQAIGGRDDVLDLRAGLGLEDRNEVDHDVRVCEELRCGTQLRKRRPGPDARL